MRILEFIAEITHGESYRSSKVELDAENSSAQIEYDSSAEIILKHSGEIIKSTTLLRGYGSRKMIYPIVAGQVVVGCCRRADKILHSEKLSAEIILAMPAVTNFDEHEGFFSALTTKINNQLTFKNFPIKILSYKTNHNSQEKFEDRADNAEKNSGGARQARQARSEKLSCQGRLA